jgi:hypothetical protein
MSQRITSEDVYPARVVRQDHELLVVLPNPQRPHDVPMFDQHPEDEAEGTPQFVVNSKGFAFFAETEVYLDSDNPDDEPVFHGSLQTDRIRRPVYQIRVTL